ncbi:MAG: L-erythro-3,5-diaminohexanoate dehydrogenase [Oligoflexia bacterium]|nr:L-erythro-3,5-diaminohexanoate dehydrogenase [Oligoflexia bacterium]
MLELDLKSKLGIHRVLEPVNALPQQALRLNPNLPTDENEILIDVEALNIDSASFHQLFEKNNKDIHALEKDILSIVQQRGKMQNPVTGSGGMLLGTIKKIGKNIQSELKTLKQGDKIATLVSLTLTPLHIEKILRIDATKERIYIKGHAILFDSGLAAKIPSDLSEGLALACLDVCGAPAQTAKLCEKNQNVVIIGGGGKSGLLSLYQAKKSVGNNGKVIAIDYSEAAVNRLKTLSFVDHALRLDARDPVTVSLEVQKCLAGDLADIVINVANIPGTEMSCILSTKKNGTVYFFSMATSFSAAALGAEGVGADLNLQIGNGYTEGHADLTYSLLRESEELRTILSALYETQP